MTKDKGYKPKPENVDKLKRFIEVDKLKQFLKKHKK